MIGRVMVNTSLPRHPKLFAFATAAKIDWTTALGHLTAIWCEVMSQREAGVLEGWTNLDLARVAGWKQDPNTLVRTLKDAGWIEVRRGGVIVIHDWEEHQGNIIEDRKLEARRKRIERAHQKGTHLDECPDVCRTSAGRPKDVRGTSSGPFPPLPLPSLPSPSLPLPPDVPSAHSHTVPAAIVSEWNRGPGFAISHEAGQKLVRAYIDSGMPAEKIHELVSNQPACKGRKLYEVLEPHRKKMPGSNGVASIEQILEKFGRGEIT